MASVTIITDICRASYVHLKEPKKFQENDDLKYRLSPMWPKSGTGSITALGVTFPSSRQNVVDAIKQVVMEEFGFDFDPDNATLAKQYGIQFPPNFKDGDTVLRKENGLPVPGQFDPIAAGNWILNLTAPQGEQPGCVEGRNLSPIDPSAIYSGCWVRCQIEVSAFVTKGTTPSRIISIKLLNVMMCYDDESFGGAGPKQEAASAFAGMAVANTNLSAGVGQGNFQPVAPAAPGKPAPMPQKPTPIAPMAAVLTMNPGCEYTYEYLSKECGWTDDQIIQGGYATMAAPTPKPTPVAPVAPAPKPMPPKPAPSVPTTGTVIMNPGCEYTYEYLSKECGWTDQDIITAGYGKPNFTNPL